MNLYVVVEGPCEKKVYKQWVREVNNNLQYVERVPEVTFNNYVIVSGGGFPNYYSIIRHAIEDINENHSLGGPIFDRLVVAVDSENQSCSEKYAEVQKFVDQHPCMAEIRIVIQHFCFEVWALGNRTIIRPNTSSLDLLKYISVHNVKYHDPEKLPACQSLNRAQFATTYLRTALRDSYPGTGYSKTHPLVIQDKTYFNQLKERWESTGHIPSFRYFLEAFL